MENKIKIGFFDSGVGGISVLTEAAERIKNADFIFYADEEHVPYGLKTREQIREYSDAALGFLKDQEVSCVVVACNTATSAAIEYLREKYDFPIIGMEPAVKPASLSHKGEKVLVCATPVTISGDRLHHLVDKNFTFDNMPDLVAMPGLVSFAEKAVFDIDTVCAYLKTVVDAGKNYSAVVLGCTHFPYFRDSFRKLFGDIDIIDGNAGTVSRLIHILSEMGFEAASEGDGGNITYVSSGRTVTDEKILDYYASLNERIKRLRNI